jgi:uncharacterized OsmC-like protein
MPTLLRTLLRGAGKPITPVEYLLLALAAVVLVTLVFFALGRLVDGQMTCEHKAQATTSSAAARC